MKQYPEELRYTETHEWVYKDPDSSQATIGVTDFLQDKLGELATVNLPEEGNNLSAGDDVCVLESVKAATDVLSPISGKITEVNEDLEDAPGLINTDPYGDGWLYKLQIKDIVEYDELFDAAEYQEYLTELGEEE